jgi:hypothetical protein
MGPGQPVDRDARILNDQATSQKVCERIDQEGESNREVEDDSSI